MLCILLVGRAQRARTSELNGNFVCMYVCMYVCLYVINRPRSVRMRPRATRKRSRPCLFRSLRSPTNALHSPSMSSTDRGQCACVPTQRANVAGLASSARCARPQMLCILLVCHQPTTVSAHASPRNARKRSRPCLFRSLHSPTNAFINGPWSVRMRPRATRKRSRLCLFRSLRSPTNALHSPSMSSTDRGQCACVPAQRANVTGLASSGRCARPQMLCILLVIGRAQRARTSELNGNFVCMYVCMFICHQPTAVGAHASPRNAQT